MLDLRKSNQRYLGFYIYKYKGYYKVGKNGSSAHTTIESGAGCKDSIYEFIHANQLK